MTDKLLSANEVAQRLNIARGSVYNLVSQKKLPAIKIFGALRFDPAEIEKLIEAGRTTSQVHLKTSSFPMKAKRSRGSL